LFPSNAPIIVPILILSSKIKFYNYYITKANGNSNSVPPYANKPTLGTTFVLTVTRLQFRARAVCSFLANKRSANLTASGLHTFKRTKVIFMAEFFENLPCRDERKFQQVQDQKMFRKRSMTKSRSTSSPMFRSQPYLKTRSCACLLSQLFE